MPRGGLADVEAHARAHTHTHTHTHTHPSLPFTPESQSSEDTRTGCRRSQGKRGVCPIRSKSPNTRDPREVPFPVSLPPFPFPGQYLTRLTPHSGLCRSSVAVADHMGSLWSSWNSISSVIGRMRYLGFQLVLQQNLLEHRMEKPGVHWC